MVSNGDYLHEMSDPVVCFVFFLKNKKSPINLLSTEFAQRKVMVENIYTLLQICILLMTKTPACF